MSLQELCGRRKQSSDSGTSAKLVSEVQCCKAPRENESLPSTSTERGSLKQESFVSSPEILGLQSKLGKLLQSQQTYPSSVSDNSTAKRHLIECTKSSVKLVEMSKSLLECKMKTDLISQDSFNQVSSNCNYHIFLKSCCTSNCPPPPPRNHTAHFSGWVPINATLEMMLHGKGSVKLKVLAILWIALALPGANEELQIQTGACQ